MLRVPLSQPLFLLGVLFVAVVHLLPGGLARLPSRLAALRRSGPAEEIPPRKENGNP